jgi:hypothetical protein
MDASVICRITILAAPAGGTQPADDIRQNGLVEPVALLDGLVLDGRNRLRACEIAGVEPRFVEWRHER